MSDQPQPNEAGQTDGAQSYDADMANPPPVREVDAGSAAELKAGAQERAQQRPLLQKILSVFRKEKGSYRELIINSEPLEKRVALLVDGRLEKFEIERESDNRMVGGIFKGRIKNLDPGLKAAFVDIGYSKNAFLHYWDMLPAAADSSVEVVRVNRKRDAQPKGDVTVKDIPSLYPPGTDIVIQVTKGPIGTKGPRTTTNLSIPGRYLILTPYSDGCGISRKIEDNNERAPPEAAHQRADDPRGHGRHRPHRRRGQEVPLFRARPAHPSQEMGGDHPEDAGRARPDLPLHGARPGRAHRPRFPDRGGRPRPDRQQGRLRAHPGPRRPRSPSAPARKIALYNDSIPIFERFNIERQIEQTGQRKVPLPSGGEIVIDETEALIAIDVNTGSHKNKAGDEKNTIYAVNLEAAREIARQIRLRNLGGLIIIDFIDMKERRHRNAVYEKMVELMATDKARNHILPISQLGIMQMTRQRQQESLWSNLYTDCPYCRGRGIVKSATTMSVELQRRLSSVARRLQLRKDGKEYSLRVLVHPSILERLRSEDADLLVRMEKSYGVKLAFRADPAYHVEHFKIINAESGEEYR